MFSRCETEYNIDRHLLSFLQDAPFFAEMSRYIRKVPTMDLPTAGVAFDKEYDDITLYWNPEFFQSLSDAEVRGVLLHEFYHLVFQHLTSRRKNPPKLWNISTDLAINSIITSGDSKQYALPNGGLIPGQFPKNPEGRNYTKEEKDAMPLASLIASLPHSQSSEWYFEKIRQVAEKEWEKMKQSCPVHGKGKGSPSEGQGDPQNNQNKSDGGNQPDKKKKGKDDSSKHEHGSDHEHGDSNEQCTCGEGWIDSLDDHSGWDMIPEEMREAVVGRVQGIVEKAVRKADSQANGWGNIPANLREEIRASISKIVDWRIVLRQFVGSLERGNRTTTMKRINKRYPYIHPGTKRGYTAKLLVAIDQSGSVSDQMLSLFFGELASLTKRISITVLPFDCAVNEKDAFEWKKGTHPEIKRVRAGGTDFNAPTKFANDPKNRGKWDGMLVLTDGECSKPESSRIKRGWVLGQGCKLHFPTDEITLTLDPNPQKSGSWR